MSNEKNLDRLAPATWKVKLGVVLTSIITLVNELRTDYSNAVTLINELKGDLNALRNDIRAHDHGATYTAATLRINGTADTISGTETNSAVAAADAGSIASAAVKSLD